MRKMILNLKLWARLKIFPCHEIKYFRETSFIAKGENKTDQSFKLTFPRMYYIDRISIWTGFECCQERIDGVQVYIDDVLLTKIEYEAGKAEYIYQVPQKRGKVIRICCATYNLAIAELEVYGSTEKGKHNLH